MSCLHLRMMYECSACHPGAQCLRVVVHMLTTVRRLLCWADVGLPLSRWLFCTLFPSSGPWYQKAYLLSASVLGGVGGGLLRPWAPLMLAGLDS
jgi:hypothetical protein